MKTSHEIKNTAQYKGFMAFYRGSNQLVLYLPKPLIEEIKAKAKKMTITPTKYITQLIEREMQDNP